MSCRGLIITCLFILMQVEHLGCFLGGKISRKSIWNKLGNDFHWELLPNILVITQSEKDYYDVCGNMYMLTGYILIFLGRCSSLMLTKDAASPLWNIQRGLLAPGLGPEGCGKKGQRESSGILGWTLPPPAECSPAIIFRCLPVLLSFLFTEAI